jgi:phosphopantothenoylcysteine decarboxylase/phosphopantothenate--cysteine ligase
VSRLVQHGYGVQVILTRAGEKFVGRATFEALSGRSVASEIFDGQAHPLGGHIEIASRGDVLCVAPATADLLARAACGMADDLLTTLLLSFEGPVLMAPAMNSEMWAKPAVQRNVARLVEDGVEMIGPDSGWLSCRRQGTGRMASPEAILSAIERCLSR